VAVEAPLWVTVAEVTAVHPNPEVTVTEYVPVAVVLILAVMAPVLHRY
jgi:cell division septal protein FtsQ